MTKVHREAQAHFKRGRKIILIGHPGHPEVVGTMGQLPPGAVTLVGAIEEVEALPFSADEPLAYVTQTTLSVDDTRDIVAALKARYPQASAPPVEDICYATTNRQEAVKRAAAEVEAFIVVGAANSSNSQRLREVAERAGCRVSMLVANAAAIDWPKLEGVASLGISAGASAPEVLVEEILDALALRFTLELETVTTATETMAFPLPKALRENAAAELVPTAAKASD